VHGSIEGKDFPRFLLLFGMARSGTSWIGKIFDSHPLTVYKHEPDRRMLEVPLAPPLDQAERFRNPITRFFAQLPGINRDHVARSLPVFAKQYRSAITQHIHRTSVLSAIAASSLGFRMPVWQCAHVDRPDVRIVWKSIDSLGRTGVILRVMENCRAVIITRHPCGSISSALRGRTQSKFASSVPPSEDYGVMQILLESARRTRGLTIEHLRQFHPIERMTWI
jgi:sulfotransferase family protein